MRRDSIVKKLKRKFSSGFLPVELTNICNLRCPLCSTGSGFRQNGKGMMEIADYRRFVDTCGALFDSVGFIGSGEPTLHPDFFEFVQFASEEKGNFCIVLKKPTGK